MTTNIILVDKLFNKFLDFLQSHGKKTAKLYDTVSVYRKLPANDKLLYIRTFVKPEQHKLAQYIAGLCIFYDVEIKELNPKDILKLKRFYQAFIELA